MSKQKICVIGNGLAGLMTAIILSKENIELDLYSSVNKKNKIKYDDRTTAISESNYKYIKKELNLSSQNFMWPSKQVNLFFEDKNIVKNFLNFNEAKKNFMYIFQNKDLKKVLDKIILKKKNINLIEKNIQNLNFDQESICIKQKSIFYDLIILCVGNQSSLYNKIEQGRSIKKNYNEFAMTSIIQHSSKINNASQFFLKEGPLAILPFKKNLFSIVWSVDSLFFNKNKNKLKQIVIKKINALVKNISIKKMTDIKTYPIYLNLKTKYFKKNILILGDGLHSIHPMAGQGFNLILRDIKKLSELFSDTLKLGLLIKNSFLLKNFYDARKPENNILGLGVNLTNLFFKDNKYFSFTKKVILKNISNFKFIKKISQSISNKGILQ
ncbi:FAD-dependent monooxygenase [Pelagibacteraceae bacterium]|jgi:2-octaprenyl-6-methoxyphenol hydroxylase|nr:FAD-dependent monooxygenase [Pelagibacteraceae bacterium]